MGINTTLLFFLLLIPISGLIALVGDRIGHRMGKKRHSFLGLRPRHTAAVFTVGSGIGISLVTFGLMYASSETFRDVLARGAALKRINRQLQSQNADLGAANLTATQRIAALNIAEQKAESEKLAAESARAEAQKRKSAAENRADDARKSLAQAEATLRGERLRLTGTSAALETAKGRVSEARALLDGANRQRDRAATEAQLAEGRVRDARREVDRSSAKIATADRTFHEVTKYQSEKLIQQRRQLALQIAQLARQEQRLTDQSSLLMERAVQLDDQSRLAERQRDQLARLGDEVKQLERKRDETQLALAATVSSARTLRDGRITYRVGEEIARISLGPGDSIWKVENHLEGLLTAGGKKAEARGARPGGELSRAALIPTHQLESGGNVTELDALRTASASIRKANQDVVVVLVAMSNAVVGEPVSADLRILRNPVVLKAGAALGEITLPDTRSRQDTADRLFAFLSGDVRGALLEAGVIPATLGDDPSEASVATLTGDEWLSLLEQARQAGPQARVVVRAAKDLHAADPVRLSFDVRSLTAKASVRRP